MINSSVPSVFSVPSVLSVVCFIFAGSLDSVFNKASDGIGRQEELPITFVFGFLQKYITTGIATTGMK